jgi:hypothetical protein
VTLAYILAQKLHACTDHSNAGRPNDRARDLIDILLVRRLLTEAELVDVRDACVEIFRLRAKHDWPPAITVLEAWPEIYATEVAKTPGFEPAEVHEAALAVDALIGAIAGA